MDNDILTNDKLVAQIKAGKDGIHFHPSTLFSIVRRSRIGDIPPPGGGRSDVHAVTVQISR